jgi:phage-related protein
MVYRRAATVFERATTLMSELEQRHVAPVMMRVTTILDDVKDVTATVKQETNRVDTAIRSTMARVDDTADRVRSNVRAKASLVVGLVRGVRVAIDTMLKTAA